ncbi:hypothetical protein NS226_23820 [Aureimonas ureilytica]|uniref:Uncharacterized protein n=1 Tax=Aureimonas ureilytica TaxID=401562 RepID=A0A175QBM0_9HYPH|nr:hypothetical protein NS226_23820 [Aureimonas ureilytica]
MPVKRMGSKATFLATVARLGPDLFADQVAQDHQTLFGATVFRLMQVKLHQAMKHAHIGMTL